MQSTLLMRFALALGLAFGGAAHAQWPALETADVVEVGGGQHDAAVLVGIDDYFILPDVTGAEANVRAWEQWLRKGRMVPGANIRRLVGAEVDKSQVQRAVELAARQVGPKGTLYFVFVGHGAPARGEAHLLLSDARKSVESFAERGVGVERDLGAWVKPATAKGAKVVAVLDACFTGKAQGGGDLIEGAQFAMLSGVAASSAMTVLSATSSKDITGPLPGAARPAFSYLVLGALRGWAATGGSGEVTAQAAVDFATGVMLDANRPEQPAFSGANLSLGKSGGEATPAYQRWLGRAVVPVRSVAAPVVSAPLLGADADIAALVAQAEQLDADRKAAEAAAQRSAEAASALATAKAAQTARLVAEAQLALKPQAARDFAAIERWVISPSDSGRPALEAFVTKYGAAAVSIDGVRYELSVPEVARVQQALGGPGGIEWVRIEGGSFSMGSDDGEDNERPRRQVQVPSFHLAKTEVTVGQYRKCVEAGACSAPDTGGACNWGQAGRDDHPVTCVSWDNAQTYAKYVGQGARLPTEAEWEFAARSGGREQKYPWGDAEATCRYAMMGDGRGNGCGAGYTTAPVCSTPSGNSAQGVCDLAGNVWEWVEDWYHDSYQGAPTDGSAHSKAAENRVYRGGGWDGTAGDLRVADRYGDPPGDGGNNLGFRLAR